MKLIVTRATLALLLCLPHGLSCSTPAQKETKKSAPNFTAHDDLLGAVLLATGVGLGYSGLTTIPELFNALQERQPGLTQGTCPEQLLSTTPVGVLVRLVSGAFFIGIGSATFLQSNAVQEFCERWNGQTDNRIHAATPGCCKRSGFQSPTHTDAVRALARANTHQESLPRRYTAPSKPRPRKVFQFAECNHCGAEKNVQKNIIEYACGHKYHTSCVKKEARANTFIQCSDCRKK